MLTKNVRITLALILIAFTYTFILGNGGCNDSVSINASGNVEDWGMTGVDTVIEDAARPVLDLGDAAVEALRDAETEVVEWGANQ